MAATDVHQPTFPLIARLAEALNDASVTAALEYQRLSNLTTNVRNVHSRQRQLAERTSSLEVNLNETNVRVTELGDAYVSVEGRTGIIENFIEIEFGGLKQQVEAVNGKLDNVMTAVQNVLVVPNSTAVRPKPKTKCRYCFKFLVDIRRHIKEQCHLAPEDLQRGAAGRLRLWEREECDICDGRYKKQSLARHRITCARRQIVTADIIGIIDTDPLGGDPDIECAPPVLEREILS